MSKQPLKRHSSKKRSGNHIQEQKRKLKSVDLEYEEWLDGLDDLDKERYSNQYVEKRESKRYKVNIKGVVYGNKECEGSHSV